MEQPEMPQQQGPMVDGEALQRFLLEYGDLRLTVLQSELAVNRVRQQLDAALSEVAALKAKYETPAEKAN